MKIVTYWHAGSRHVGRLSADGGAVTPLVLGEPVKDRGALVLIERMAAGLAPPSDDVPLLPLS